MSVEYLVPDVGEGIAEIEVLSWAAEVGDRVEADAVLVEAETDKSVVEIPAPVSGVLVRRGVEVGGRAAVGDLLAVIDADPGSAPPATDAPSGGDDPGMTPPTADTVPGAAAPAAGDNREAPAAPQRRPLASPHTRRLAAQRGIDLATITGTGPHGRILESDLDAAAAGPAPAPGDEPAAPLSPATAPVTAAAPRHASAPRRREQTVIPLTGVRRATARAMTAALTIPHITEFREVDATRLLAARSTLAERLAARGQKLSVFALLVAAVARALAEHPSFNATFDAEAEATTRYSAADIGIATATDDGLLVPVLRDAGARALTELAAELDRLAAGARARTLPREELTGSTFTITNFGSFGTWLGQPIIRPPEVAIAGFGRIADRVIPVRGKAKVRPVLPIVIAADHRIHDGIHVAAFLDTIAEVVAEPLTLLA